VIGACRLMVVLLGFSSVIAGQVKTGEGDRVTPPMGLACLVWPCDTTFVNPTDNTAPGTLIEPILVGGAAAIATVVDVAIQPANGGIVVNEAHRHHIVLQHGHRSVRGVPARELPGSEYLIDGDDGMPNRMPAHRSKSLLFDADSGLLVPDNRNG
jgi:hypothetical protein